MTDYRAVYRESFDERESFWLKAAEAISWVTPPTRALDDSRPPFYRWFPDGELNTCANALDRHIDAGRGEQAALIYDSPLAGVQTTLTYRQLRDETARFAGALVNLGVGKGDRVVIYMPMIPEAVVAMLACARIGAVHSVVFGGFAARELSLRIDDAAPKVIISASCGIQPAGVFPYKPLLDEAIAEAQHKPERCIIVQRPELTAPMGERDIDWVDAMATAQPVDPVTVKATDPLYVLYTSGTTGKPKGVVRDNGGHAVALAWSMKNLYDTGIGETYWAASDVGWVVGHSYIVYGPLIAGCTTVLYEGKPVGTPDAGAFWRVISQYGVKTLFTAPTAIRAIKRVDPDGAFARATDLSAFQYLFLAGERLDPETYSWASDLLGVPVLDNWWQTETGWPVNANPVAIEALPIKPGSSTVPVPGFDIRVVDETGNDVPAGTDGAIVIRLPLPPGTLPTLWQDDDRYVSSYLSYLPGHYLTGDTGHFDEDGYLFVMGRADDVINVAGHRLSTGSMEEAIARHPRVAECAVIGVYDDLKGQVPRAFVVLKAGDDADAEVVSKEVAQLVRDKVGAIASLSRVDVVPALPKTRSGKILRRTMRGIADGRDEPVPSTIEDRDVLDALRPTLTASLPEA